MKINLNDIFDWLDIQKTQQIAKHNIPFDCDSDITERIKKKTFSKLNLSNNKNKLFIKYKQRIGFKSLVAISIAFVIVFSSISVVAVAYVLSGSTLPDFFTVDDFIYNIAREVDTIKNAGFMLDAVKS